MIPELSTDLPTGEQPEAPGNQQALTTNSQRIDSLDVLRGIAVMLGLFVSIWYFGGFTNYQDFLLTHTTGGNFLLWGGVDLLLNGKMQALIAVVFGAGMVLFLLDQNDNGIKPLSDLFIRRQIWLIVFGLINALVFLWTRDVLFHLGIMGILLFPFIRLSRKALWIAALAMTIIYCGKTYWNFSEHQVAHSKYLAVVAAEKKISKDSLSRARAVPSAKTVITDSLSKTQQEDKSKWEEIVAGQTYDPQKDKAGVKEIRRGSYAKIWNYLLPAAQSREALWTYETGIWEFGAMILAGMALYKTRFFQASFSRRSYIIIAFIALIPGFLLGWLRLLFNHYALVNYASYLARYKIPYDLFFPFEQLFLVVGYTSGILLLMRLGWLRFLWQGFACAGRLSLTNYLVQSLLCSLFFTGFGFGYFGRLSQGQLYLFAAEIILVQTVFSIFWLRYYRLGPVEWLLRCLMYWEWIPIKKQLHSPSSSVHVVS